MGQEPDSTAPKPRFPNPHTAEDFPAFQLLLNEVRKIAGLSYEAVEKKSGQRLPGTSANRLLTDPNVPPTDGNKAHVETLLRVCGVPQNELENWLGARERLWKTTARTSSVEPTFEPAPSELLASEKGSAPVLHPDPEPASTEPHNLPGPVPAPSSDREPPTRSPLREPLLPRTRPSRRLDRRTYIQGVAASAVVALTVVGAVILLAQRPQDIDRHDDKSGTPPPSLAPTPSRTDRVAPLRKPAPDPVADIGALPANTEKIMGVQPCTPADLRLALTATETSYPPARDPLLRLTIEQAGVRPCRIDLGRSNSVLTFTPVGASAPAWSSAHCPPTGEARWVWLEPGRPVVEVFNWDRSISTDNCAKPTGSTAKSGSYRAAATLLQLSARTSLTLRPAPPKEPADASGGGSNTSDGSELTSGGGSGGGSGSTSSSGGSSGGGTQPKPSPQPTPSSTPSPTPSTSSGGGLFGGPSGGD